MHFKVQIKDLSAQKENNTCIDCKVLNTHWASTSYGIFLCLECASKHRSYGVLISRVKSINMDNWTEEDYNLMLKGGNKKFREFIEYHGLSSLSKEALYKHDLIKQYKETIYGKEENVRREIPVQRKYDYQDRHGKSNESMKEYIGQKASDIKTKGIEMGSTFNKKWLSPTAVLLKQTFMKVKNKITKNEEVKEKVEYEGVKSIEKPKDDMSKWD